MFQNAPQYAFNGLTTDPACMSGNVNGLLTWAPATDVTFRGNLEVFCIIEFTVCHLDISGTCSFNTNCIALKIKTIETDCRLG